MATMHDTRERDAQLLTTRNSWVDRSQGARDVIGRHFAPVPCQGLNHARGCTKLSSMAQLLWRLHHYRTSPWFLDHLVRNGIILIQIA